MEDHERLRNTKQIHLYCQGQLRGNEFQSVTWRRCHRKNPGANRSQTGLHTFTYSLLNDKRLGDDEKTRKEEWYSMDQLDDLVGYIMEWNWLFKTI